MPAEKDQSIDLPEEIRDEVQKIIDLLSEDSDGEEIEVINLGDINSTVEEMEMMALLHCLRKGLPLHEAEKRAKEIVEEQLEIERLFEENARSKSFKIM